VAQTPEYPAIVAFVRGYLHEDAMEEYGSAQAAARQFCRDADPTQVRELRREWKRFHAHHRSLNDVNDILRELGGAWLFSTIDEFEGMVDATKGSKH